MMNIFRQIYDWFANTYNSWKTNALEARKTSDVLSAMNKASVVIDGKTVDIFAMRDLVKYELDQNILKQKKAEFLTCFANIDADGFFEMLRDAESRKYFAELASSESLLKHQDFIRSYTDFLEDNTLYSALFNEVFSIFYNEFFNGVKSYTFAEEITFEAKVNSINLKLLESSITMEEGLEILKSHFDYNALHLAILLNNAEIVDIFTADEIELLALSPSITGITPLELMTSYGYDFSSLKGAEKALITPKLLNSPHNQQSKNTFLDLFVEADIDPALFKEYVPKDSMYSLLLNDDADFSEFFADTNKTYIGISASRKMPETDTLSVAHKLMNEYPNIQFYVINRDVIQQSDDSIYQYIDGIVNPGGVGYGIVSGQEYNKSDISEILNDGQNTYHAALDAAKVHKFPVLGICMGSTSFILNNEGALKALDGYRGAVHEMSFEPGTLGHLMSLTKPQLVTAFETNVLPEIKFFAHTNHTFNVSNQKLGTDVKLDAISSYDGQPMSFSTIE